MTALVNSSRVEQSPASALRSQLAWARANLFARPIDVLLTSTIAAAAVALIWAIVPWAFIDAVWIGENRAACRPDAACWAFIVNRGGQFLYGFYPQPERWRVNAVFLIFAVSVFLLLRRDTPGKRVVAFFLLLVFPILGYVLLHGGVAGLSRVTTDKWGGLSLTLLLGVAGIVVSFPIAIVLALGRQSEMPLFRWASIAYIEICR